MKMKRRVHAWFLALLMIVTTVLGVYTPSEVKADDGTTVIIHYQRPDGDYENWDIWAWGGSVDGAQTFDYEDSFGKVCVIQASDVIEELGFIIRKGEWEAKDFDGDQFITVTDGFAEVWIQSGQEGYSTTAPDGAAAFDLSQIGSNGGGSGDGSETGGEVAPPAEGQIAVKLHYYRYDENYSGWNVWFWPEGGDGTANDFTGSDDFGKIASYNVDASAGKLGFIIRLNDWEAKDVETDRYIDLSKAVDGVLDVYIIEADEAIHYDVNEADLSPKFISASLNTGVTIKVKVTTPVNTDATESLSLFKVVDGDGNEYAISNLFSEAGLASEFEVNMKESLDLTKAYKIVSDTYGEVDVTFGDVYSSEEFEKAFYYDGDDLGATYSKESTTFKVWSPLASNVQVRLYKNGYEGMAYETVDMTKGDKGVWEATIEGDLNGSFYTYQFTHGETVTEAPDLYARTTGVNGKRAMIIDLDSTDPEGWDKDLRPELLKATDSLIYETHVRDFTIDESSGVTNKGKYLGLTEKGTVNSSGVSTGLDHIIELGVTHVQLMPVYDYSPNSVDESNLSKPQFNWGYDPYNYNVPEGSYSTNPFDGNVRVNEFKQMVQAFHENDIRVIMDVVYNHTAENANSWMSLTVPGYYYRMNEDGSFSNGSGCGNELASERAMVRKYIIDSVVYWATEYHVDGFRFDLFGLIDIETMQAVREALDEVDPTILVYGEGWTGGTSLLSANEAALKKNTVRFEGQIGAFSDDIRDGLKGSVFSETDKGFATGKAGQEERIKSGVIGATNYPGIDWANTGTDIGSPWTNSPIQVINYTSCHDNHTLWDKICISNADDTEEDRIKMNNLCASVVYTSQGIPFILSGEEILRSKGGDSNSYKSSDEVNGIKWDEMNTEVFEYYKGLIEFRKAHAALRMTTAEDVEKYLAFIDDVPANVVAYTVDGAANGEIADQLLIIYNANKEEVEINIPEGEWKVCINGEEAGTKVLSTVSGGKVKVSPISCMALVKGETALATSADADANNDSNNTLLYVIIGVVAVVVVVAIIILVTKKGGKKAKTEEKAKETKTDK